MGIQINGTTDTISATDGSLSIAGQELTDLIGITVTGIVTATSFSGDGSSLTGISAGARGGGSDEVFYENGQSVTTNYTISTSKNAMSAGPIGIATGVTVTIPSGSTWTIV